jgi:hypothetical protein
MHFPRKVLQCQGIGEPLRTTIANFVQETIGAIQAGIFAPEKYTNAGGRLFTLAPIYSFQLHHIPLNQYTMPPIFRAAGIPCAAQISTDNFQALLWQHIDFGPIGFHRREELRTDNLEFR